MSEFTAKNLKEARMKAGFTQDEAADLMKTTKRAISQIEADKRVLSADELAQFEYSCAMKSHFRKSGNQMSGKWKSSYASLLA